MLQAMHSLVLRALHSQALLVQSWMLLRSMRCLQRVLLVSRLRLHHQWQTSSLLQQTSLLVTRNPGYSSSLVACNVHLRPERFWSIAGCCPLRFRVFLQVEAGVRVL
jgi:hypothetical protein